MTSGWVLWALLRQGAKGRYPDLTDEQFNEAAQAVLDALGDESFASLSQMSVLLDTDLRLRYGPPVGSEEEP